SIQGSAIPTGASAGACHLCGAWRGWRSGFRSLYETPAGHAGALPALPPKDGLVPTRSGRSVSWIDGMVCAAGLGRGLWLCRRCFEWTDGTEPDGSVGGPEAPSRDHKLCFGQRRWNFRPRPVHRRHVGRRGGHRGASFVARPYSHTGRLCAGGNGSSLRGHRARSYDFSGDDLRDDAGLCRHRPADDCESGEPFHFLTIAAAAHLRGLGSTGWNTPAYGGGTTTAWSAPGNSNHACCDRVTAE